MDKVPVLDSAGHFVMTPLAATSGAIVFASQAGTIRQVDPGLTVVMSLLIGGGTATAVHLTRATVRPVANVGLMGPVVSTFEDVTAAVLSLAVLLAPVLLPMAAVGFALAVWAVWRQRSRRRAAAALAQQQWWAYSAGYSQPPYGQPHYGYPPPYGHPPQPTQPYGGTGPPYRTG